MRSSLLLPALAILMATVPLGCRPKAEAPSVVIYVSYDQNFSEPLLREFEERSGIHVLPVFDVEAAKTTGLVNRLIAEQQSPRADVWMNGEFVQTLKLKQQGILTPYRSPAAENLPEQYVDPEGYWTGLPGRARVMLVNTDRVPAEQYPSGIEDLADSHWGEHQVSMAYPIFGTTATEAAAMYAWLGPEQALAFYKQLKAAGVRIVDGNATSRDLISSGEVKAGLTDSDDAWGAVKRGAPVKIIIPDQEEGGRGTLVIPGTVAMVAGGPNPEQARALIDYLVSEEVERKLLAAGFCQVPLRAHDAAPDWLEVERLRTMPVSFAEVFEQFERAQGEMRELFVR